MSKRFNIFFILFISVSFASAGSGTDATDSVPHSIVGKVINYFNNTNRPTEKKDFDISFIGGPHYSSDTKFGIGAVAAGVYRHDKSDTLIQPSNVSIYLDATTSLFFKIGVKGTHFFPHDKYRLSYDINFESVNSDFWGIGYRNAINDQNESKYKYLASQIEAEFVFRTAPSLYIGPKIAVDYIDGRNFEKPWLLGDEAWRTFNLGMGITIQYDTRDNITASSRGIYICLNQTFNPRFLANEYSFALTELSASSFRKLWRGSVLAVNLHSRLTFGDTPWGLLSTLGGSSNMRGYYEGRYRDKSEIDACIELRQHIWHRNGVVVWGGAGSIFPKFSAIRSRHILPNYGIGYRWEFKKFINVRLDLGFGRKQTGFIFSINEAF